MIEATADQAAKVPQGLTTVIKDMQLQIAGAQAVAAQHIFATQNIAETPAGTVDINGGTSGAPITWYTMISTQLLVPTWATSCRIIANIHGPFINAALTNNMQLRPFVDTQVGRYFRVDDPGVLLQRFHIGFSDTITGLTPGSLVSVGFQGYRATGSGALRLDTSCNFCAAIDWTP